MKHTLKFLLALGDAKLVVLESGNKNITGAYAASESSQYKPAMRRITNAIIKQ